MNDGAVCDKKVPSVRKRKKVPAGYRQRFAKYMRRMLGLGHRKKT
jgi:hypothetical protein